MKTYTFSMFGKVIDSVQAEDQYRAELKFIDLHPEYKGFTAKVTVK